MKRRSLKVPVAWQRLALLREELKLLGFKIDQNALRKAKREKYLSAEILGQLESLIDRPFASQKDFEQELIKSLSLAVYEEEKEQLLALTQSRLKLLALESAQADYQMNKKDFAAARATLSSAIQYYPNTPGCYHALGRLEYLCQKYPAALAAFNQALKIIDAPQNQNDGYFQSHRMTVLGDRIRTLNKLGKYIEAKQELNRINPKYHVLPSFKAAFILTEIKLGKLEVAVANLQRLYDLYQLKFDDWSEYKLTTSRLRRLDFNKAIPLNIREDLQKQLSWENHGIAAAKHFFHRLDFIKWLRKLIPTASEEILDTIADTARYHRHIHINAHTLARLYYELFWAFEKRQEYEAAYCHITRCYTIESESLEIIHWAAIFAYATSRPHLHLVEAGLCLPPRNEQERDFIATLYILKDDLATARTFSPKTMQIVDLLRGYRALCEPEH